MIWPASVPFKECNYAIERSLRVFDNPFGGGQQQVDHGGALWELEVKLANLSREQAGQVLGLLAEHGRTGILIPDAPHATPLGSGGGEPVTVGENQGGRMAITGAEANKPGWLKAGDLIQVGSHMHLLTRDGNTDGSGSATLSIFPYLRTLPAPGTRVLTRHCACLMQLQATQEIPRRVPAGGRYLAQMKLKFIEVMA